MLRGPALAALCRMETVFAICLFALDRVRTVLLALSLIVLMKLAWVMLTQNPA
jgi:drug/metabolite transporter superfamily protein YnfA